MAVAAPLFLGKGLSELPQGSLVLPGSKINLVLLFFVGYVSLTLLATGGGGEIPPPLQENAIFSFFSLDDLVS